MEEIKYASLESQLGNARCMCEALCCMRGNLQDRLRVTYRNDMKVGHHTAYQSAVEVFLGKISVEKALRQAKQDRNDRNAVVAMYGIAGHLEHCGSRAEAENVTQLLLRRESAWPCISYLAAWNDKNNIDGRRGFDLITA